MKLLTKYNPLIPAAALIYGIYLLNYQLEEGIIEELNRTVMNGWIILWFLFTFFMAGMIYQLQNNKRWEYIYSFPWTRGEIYKDCFRKMHIASLAAGALYASFYGIKCYEISNQGILLEILESVLLNLIIYLFYCAVTEFCLIGTAYIWQGVLLSAGVLYVGIPLFLENLGLVIQSMFGIRSTVGILAQKVLYHLGGGIRYPREVESLIFDFMDYGENQWKLWNIYAMGIILGCLFLLFLCMIGVFWKSKKQYEQNDLSKKRMLTRMRSRWNRWMAAGIIGVGLFHLIGNRMLQTVLYTKIDGIWDLEMVFLEKSIFLSGSDLDMIEQTLDQARLSDGRALWILLLCLVSVYGTLWGIQAMRRRFYERT